MDECGLLSSNGFIENTIKDITETKTIFQGKEFEITATPTTNNTIISVGIFPLSESGKDLYQVIKGATNKNYINDIVEELSNQQNDFSIALKLIN